MHQIFNGTTNETTSTSFSLPQTSTLLIKERDQSKSKLASSMLIRIVFGTILFFAICLLLFHMYKKFTVMKNHKKKKQMNIHNVNQIMEPVYQDIGGSVELVPQQRFTTLSIDAERPILPPRVLPAKPSNTRSTLTIENNIKSYPQINRSNTKQPEVECVQ